MVSKIQQNNSEISLLPHCIFKFKISFIGDYNVGKTSILNRYLYDTFSENI